MTIFPAGAKFFPFSLVEDEARVDEMKGMEEKNLIKNLYNREAEETTLKGIVVQRKEIILRYFLKKTFFRSIAIFPFGSELEGDVTDDGNAI